MIRRSLPLLFGLALSAAPAPIHAGANSCQRVRSIRVTSPSPAPMPVARDAGRLWASLAPLPTSEADVRAPAGHSGSAGPADKFESALRRIQSEYAGPLPKTTALTYAAIRGMVQSVGDRYTRFLDPVQFRRMQEENSGEYGGIGVTLSLNARNEPVVTRIDATVAQPFPIHVGDVITSVLGHPIFPSRSAAERAQDLIHGDAGTPVAMALRRRSLKKPLQVTLLRKLIYVPTVSYRMLEHGVGYVKLDSFGERSDEELGIALRRMKSQGMRALVFDLRGNPGGFFNSAIDIASRFINRGPVVYTKDRENQRVPVPNIPSKQMVPGIALAVIVDHWSASAAEIVAAAIQDTGAGILIGQRTYGKALVQTISPISDGSALLVTTHHYYTPLGTDISHKGVLPNIVLDPASRAVPGKDAPVERAVAWLSDPSRLSRRR